MIEKQELVEGIRFAGRRAASALETVQEWDYQLGHQWTTADAFRHVAGAAGQLEGFYPMLDGDVLTKQTVDEYATINDQGIEGLGDKSRDEVRQMILDGAEESAKYAETLDQEDLDQVITLGGYHMSKGEIVAQIWIHHQIAHSYEASGRWPIQ
ncbi:MAG TPA: maleylpyruvate isomerase N-terminal domain-containing protein [Dehalococcoidia bacterium]|nr:maleylpyruvate isomerase N-terminal domain-containing protein [Dehalococcoidia bacterium]